jgi:hypothetical protein
VSGYTIAASREFHLSLGEEFQSAGRATVPPSAIQTASRCMRYPFRVTRRKEHRVEYVWLCTDCAPKYSLSWDRNQGMALVPVSGVPEAEERRKVVIAVNGGPSNQAA